MTPEEPEDIKAEDTPVEEAADAASGADAARSDEPEAAAEPETARAASAADATPAEPADEPETPDAEKKPAPKKPRRTRARRKPVEADATAEAEAADAEKPAAEAPASAVDKPAAETPAPAADKPAAETPAADKPARPAPRRRRSRREPGEPAPVVRAQAKYVRSSARKARLVCDHIRGKSVDEARAILAVTPRAIARDWSKLLESAVANAEHNHELVGEDLYVKAVHADEGPTIKRFRPRAMGRATRIRKRTSHLTILLTPKD